jgi:hypothetical protein
MLGAQDGDWTARLSCRAGKPRGPPNSESGKLRAIGPVERGITLMVPAGACSGGRERSRKKRAKFQLRLLPKPWREISRSRSRESPGRGVAKRWLATPLLPVQNQRCRHLQVPPLIKQRRHFPYKSQLRRVFQNSFGLHRFADGRTAGHARHEIP